MTDEQLLGPEIVDENAPISDDEENNEETADPSQPDNNEESKEGGSKRPKIRQKKPNVAVTMKRALYEKGPNWDFGKFREHMFEKCKNVDSLPELHFFDGFDTMNA